MNPPDTRARPTGGPAFLLAQLGAHAAMRFAQRLTEHHLTPALVGILRLLRETPGQSQQALAERLGVQPSRLVPLVDDLEERGLIRRERSRADRRVNAVELTADGVALLRTVSAIVRAHEASLFAGLDADELATLTGLLARIADQQGLAGGVHPGYRTTTADTSPNEQESRPGAGGDPPRRQKPIQAR
jgi:DNA-binding MarR family transcriptional regulator